MTGRSLLSQRRLQGPYEDMQRSETYASKFLNKVTAVQPELPTRKFKRRKPPSTLLKGSNSDIINLPDSCHDSKPAQPNIQIKLVAHPKAVTKKLRPNVAMLSRQFLRPGYDTRDR